MQQERKRLYLVRVIFQTSVSYPLIHLLRLRQKDIERIFSFAHAQRVTRDQARRKTNLLFFFSFLFF